MPGEPIGGEGFAAGVVVERLPDLAYCHKILIQSALAASVEREPGVGGASGVASGDLTIF